MQLNDLDYAAIQLTLLLATVTSLLLITLGSPLAWTLSRAHPKVRSLGLVIISLPLVLPPTVLGFYLLQAFGPDGLIGELWYRLSERALNFSFSGLVLGSMVYSLPFAVIPLLQGFQQIPNQTLEQAAMLGASERKVFYTLVLPTCIPAYLLSTILCFAHTLGEFGVALMVGGNIPGSTQVVSIRIFEHVETLNLPAAHHLSIIMCLVSLAVISITMAIQPKKNPQLI